MLNEAQYDLSRKAAKISALSSNNSGKYESLTGEDLGLKPGTIQQNNNIDTKPPNVFNYLKSLSQEAKDLMDDKEDANDDIDDGKFFLLVITEKKLTLTFLGSH